MANALYQYQRHNLLSDRAVAQALISAQRLPIQLFADALLHQQALRLAMNHGLPATYDAHYLALAMLLEAEFWTADKKLVNTVKSDLEWVRLWQ